MIQDFEVDIIESNYDDDGKSWNRVETIEHYSLSYSMCTIDPM